MFEIALVVSLGLSAMLIIWRLIDVIATINIQTFEGHPVQFAALAVHWALIGAGTVATMAGEQAGGYMLMVAIALLFAFDRRRSPPHDHT